MAHLRSSPDGFLHGSSVLRVFAGHDHTEFLWPPGRVALLSPAFDGTGPAVEKE